LPTVSLSEGIPPAGGGQLSFLPARYEGKLYMVAVGGDGKVRIWNLTDKTLTFIEETEDPNKLSWHSRLIDWKMKTNSTVIFRALHARSGLLVIERVEADLSALTASRTEESTISLSWLDKPGEISHATTIPPRLIVMGEEDPTANLHYVDLETGDDNYWDTGFGSYQPWPSPKFVVRNDDIYMALGKHLSGSIHMYVKLYSHTIVDLESAGGGSPRPMIGGKSWFYDELLFPLTNGGVQDKDNDILIYDDSFTKIGTIDLAGITGWSYNDAMCGFNIYAKKSDGGYYMLLGVMDDCETYATKYRLYHVELNSTFGVVSSSLLFERDWRYVAENMNSDYTDWNNVPIVDHNAKKMYIVGSYTDVSESSPYSWIAEIDLSDVWDNIAEWNKSMWHIGALGKIPTILTLTVTEL